MPTFSSPGTHTYTVPTGVQQIEADLSGPGGGGGEGSGAGSGGDGGRLVITIDVTPGEDLTVYVGGGGGGGADGIGGVGGAGLNNGGDGGDGGFGGGAGGGSTAIARTSDGHVFGNGEAGGGGGAAFGADPGAGGGGADGGVGGSGTSGEDGDDAGGTGNGGDGGGGEEDGGDGGVTTDGGVTVVSSTVGGGAAGGGVETAGTDGSVTITEAPPAPTNVAVTGHTDTTISVSWDDVDGEDNYVVEYSTDGGNSWTEGATTAADATSETVTGLADGTEHDVRVGAANSAGASYSGAVTQITNLPAATDLAVANVTSDTADVSWTDNATDETGYRVLLSTDGGATYTNVSGDSSPGSTTTNNDLAPDTESYTPTGLRDGEEYTCAVEVIGNDTTTRA